jgi:acetylornithine/succinyldiaminopimelate/putrescine aminotransferase
LRALIEDGVLEHAERQGEYLRGRLVELQGRCSRIRAVRGRGMLWGLELDSAAAPFVDQARDLGLIVNATAERVVRLAPPLIVSPAEIDEAVEILAEVLEK